MKKGVFLIFMMLPGAAFSARDRSHLDHESVFRQFLNPSIAAKSDGAGDYWQKMRQFHRYLSQTVPTPDDAMVERAILSEINHLGMSPKDYTHIRATCRSLKCEYVLIFNRNVDRKRSIALSNAFQSIGDRHCAQDDCHQSVLMAGGGPGEDGAAILIQKSFKHF